jgi:anion-transporting  ArsA/GET3 family ATPase
VRSADRPSAELFSAIESRNVLIVCGSGGVGKTTTAAALALRAALGGRRVLVCTIDPSRRLATSLGLEQLPDKPRLLNLARLWPAAAGSMWAMTLDTKRTFDRLVERYAANEAARDRILNNRFYKHVSAALAGSHEYMAVEKLLELSADPRFDLVVLDTPPTRHALDFLEAPDRLLGVLDTSVLRWFLKPYFLAGRLTLKVATATGALAMRLADRFLGLQFLQDLSEFFLAFETMYAGFKERAAKVHALLRSPSSGFVLVASPARPTLDEALHFYRRLRDRGMPFVSFVVNRLHPEPGSGSAPKGRRKSTPAPRLAPDLAEALTLVLADQEVIARSQRSALVRLQVDADEPLVLVPEFEADVHDLRGLADVGDAIFGEASRRSARLSRSRAHSRQGAVSQERAR